MQVFEDPYELVVGPCLHGLDHDAVAILIVQHEQVIFGPVGGYC